jgi:hypothetical protein
MREAATPGAKQGWRESRPGEPEILITERRLEPRPLTSRYAPGLGEHVPVDPCEEEEPEEEEPEDLSEP